MNACYHPQLSFTDPAFGQLNYRKTCAMWAMLCASATDLTIGFTVLKATEEGVETRWLADYTFGKTGRKVQNNIIARMTIREGKIICHTDDFNLHKWARQALGLQGWLFGGTAYFKRKLHLQTNRQLARFMQKYPAGYVGI